MDRHRMQSLNVFGSAFERVEYLMSINEYRNKWVVVLIVEEAVDDFMRADIQKANPLIGFCMEFTHKSLFSWLL